MLRIETRRLLLVYNASSPSSFNEDNLAVTVKDAGGGAPATWQPVHNGDALGNLYGTVRTLDGANGPVQLECTEQARADLHCTYGLVSKAGYVVVDDTHKPIWDGNTSWPWIAPRSFAPPARAACAVPDERRRDCGYPGITDEQCMRKGCCLAPAATGSARARGIPVCFYATDADQDLYMFGHGRRYKEAMADFVAVSGRIPIPPRYAFGVFFSRYWAYSDVDSMGIVREYESHRVPLDVLVTDMDWHITFYKEANAGKKDQAGMTIGWSGYTWDAHLFPDPDGFMAWCKARGLKNTLNLHPASGMQPWEAKYADVARAMGIDPATQRYVPFNITDVRYATQWSRIVLADLERRGVDFWWLDWQQGEDWFPIAETNPTFWLNYVFFTNPYHWSAGAGGSAAGARQMLLHRWGGLGNHRYQVGFSGDVVPSWESLRFQPLFTARAANVGYGYWSHDLGGHTAPSPPELYTRWVQWGAFSPIFRTHCTKNANNDRRIWIYPYENYRIMRQAMLLRQALVPYIYTFARRAHDTGLSILLPMYFDWPDEPAAYQADQQFMFGDQLLVAPVTTPVDSVLQLAMQSVWLPPGRWVDTVTGSVYTGPVLFRGDYRLSEMPVFARAGAVIPLNVDDLPPIGQAQRLPYALKLLVHVGGTAGGNFSLYEDDGTTQAYLSGNASCTTSISWTADDTGTGISLVVGPARGARLVARRSYDIRLRGVYPAKTVRLSGRPLPYRPPSLMPSLGRDPHVLPADAAWSYDGELLELRIQTDARPTIEPVQLSVTLQGPLTDRPLLESGFAGAVARMQAAKVLLDGQWGEDTVYQEDYADLLHGAEAGARITYDPSSAVRVVSTLGATAVRAAAQVQALSALAPAVRAQALAYLQRPA